MRGEASEVPIDRICSYPVGLRMPRALETLEHVVQQLERGQLSAIEALLAEEITIRESRRVKAALQKARLASVKTLSGFEILVPAFSRPQPDPHPGPARLHRSP